VKEYQKITLLPRDTNSHGTIFGGVILSYIDLAGAACCHDHYRNRCFTTLVMREVKFLHPVHVSDLLTLSGEVVRAGRTSVTVRVEARAFNRRRRQEELVAATELVYVAMDPEGGKEPLQPAED